MTGRLRRVATIALLLWAAWWHVIATAVILHTNGMDFGRFYYSVAQWRDGRSFYDPSPATWLPVAGHDGLHLWNLNPPHATILVWPFTLLPLPWAYAVWMLVNAIAFAYAARMIARTLGARLTGWDWALAAAALLSSAAYFSHAANGQLAGIMTLVVTAAWCAWRERRWHAAGLALGCAAAIKLFAVPLLVFAVAKRRCVVLGVALTIAGAAFGMGIVALGWPEYVRWWQAVSDVKNPIAAVNSSIIAPWGRAVASSTGDPVSLQTPIGALLLATVLGCAGGVAALRDRDTDRAWLLLLTTIVLAFPLGWTYYWLCFLGPLIACWNRAGIRWGAYLSAPGWFFPVVWTSGAGQIPDMFTGSVYTWALLILWLGILVTWVQDRVNPARDCEQRKGFPESLPT